MRTLVEQSRLIIGLPDLPELGWDDAEVERQAHDYRAAVATERDAAGLPESAIDALSR